MVSSYVTALSALLFLFFIPFKIPLNLYLMITLVIVKLTEEYKKRNYYYNRFTLERYIKKYNFNKLKIIGNIDKMMRDKRHLIKNKNRYYTEKQLLSKKYRYK